MLAVVLAILAGVLVLGTAPEGSAAPPTGSPLNPVSGNQGFLAFVEGNAALNQNSSQGAVALGGDLTLSMTNKALGRSIVASSTSGTLVPNNADDGDVNTYWQSSGAFPQTLTVDLGATRSVSQFTLRLPPTFPTRTQTLSILGSTNGTTYTTINGSATYTFNPATGNGVVINSSTSNRRYVRLNITANSAISAGQIAELEVRAPTSGGGNVYDVADTSPGTFTAPGDARPTGLLVGGRMDWAGSAGNGYAFVHSTSYVKVGNLTGTDVLQGGGSSTHLVIDGDGYNSQPGIALDLAQPTASVNQSGLVNFTSAFTAYRTRSTDLAACDNTVVLRNSGGTPLPPTLPANTNAFITLTPGVQNVLNITAANLANIATLTFTNHPNASTPLVINVNTAGVGDDFTWRPPSPNGLNDPDSAFILWNFATTTRLTIDGSSPVRGTVYTPRAGLFAYDPSGIYGNVIAQSYAQGGPLGSPSGGDIRNFPFATSVQTCAAQLVISKTADTSSTVAGGTVRYTVTATNTGGTTSTGATFTDALAGVLDDATYNNDATATTGSVNVTGSNLTWTGNVPGGAAATVSYSVTVNTPDAGNHRLVNAVTSTTAGSTCPVGNSDPQCATNVPVAELVIHKVADVTTTTVGGTVHYTVTITNAGQTAYTGISVADNLSGALDDAAYNGDAAATTGAMSFSTPNLTWTGNLAIGASATITFSMTVNNPDTGDKVLVNVVSSTATGNNCPSGSADPQCRVTVGVLVSGLTISKVADATTTTPGSDVEYTLTIRNTGQLAYTGTTVTDALTDVLDDATYNNDATTTSGSVNLVGSNLVWTGNLAVGAPTVTITYSVTVHDPVTGDHALTNTVTSTAASNNCPTGGTDPRCTVTVDVAALDIVFTTDPAASTTPGSVVTFNTTITNEGQAPYTGITLALPRAGISDDATANGDQTATSGTLTLTATDLDWTGNVPVGGSVFITGTVTVHNPDTGNHLIEGRITTTATGSNCPPGNTNPRCAIALPVLDPVLTIVKSADVTTTTQGGTVEYTVTATNDGNTPYTGAVIEDHLAGVLDDADYNADASATSGTVDFNSPTLTWTGNLAIGATVTITFTVTVDNPDTGDKTLVNAVTSTDTGSTCPPARGGDCSAIVPVLVQALTIRKTADKTATTPGGTVAYSITATNTGNLPYTGAQITDNLTGVLDDATYNNNGSATTGSVAFTSPNLTWTGNLSPGASVTITYTVTVTNPDTGNQQLTNVISSAAAGNNCATGSSDAHCTATVNVEAAATLTFTKTANVTETAHGHTVTYTITATNSGGMPYAGATFTDDIAGALDDATYNNNASATAGVATYVAPNLTWTGTVPAGGTVTVTYTMTVNATDEPGGNDLLTNTVTSVSPGNNCVTGNTDTRCGLTVPIVDVVFVNAVSPTPTTAPGAVVTFTATITNSSPVTQFGVTATLDPSDLSDDLTSNGDQTATSGSLIVTPSGATWSGDVPPGATVTVTGSATVNNPDTGNKRIRSVIVSDSLGSNCATGSSDPQCTAETTVLVPELTVTKSAGVGATTQGGTVGYTVTITNDGNTTYTGAEVTDDLTGVLDDAAYNNNAVVTGSGSATYTSPTLTWTGDLAIGATVTITYTVTVDNPDTGDKTMVNTMASDEDGSNCTPGGGLASCSVTVAVLVPGLTIVKTTPATGAVQGAVVDYTITITNTGNLTYTGATVTDNLTGVLDDSAYNNDADVTGGGTATYTSPNLVWTGNLAVGATVTITYSATVDNPDTGDAVLTNTMLSSAAGNNCPTGGVDPRCTTSVPVSILVIVHSANAATTTPGGVVVHTTTITNNGQRPYVGAVVNLSLGDILDDATYNGDGTSTSGTVVFDVDPLRLVWTGDVPVGGTVTLQSSVTVNDPDTGNQQLITVASSAATGNNCPDGSTDPRCTSTVQVLIPELTITKVADVPSTIPGATVTYTITVTNTGETAYDDAVVTDDIDEVLDDATYNDDAAASTGTVDYVEPTITWTGDLAVAASATITYTVTVDDPYLGDGSLINSATSSEEGSTCPPGGQGQDCTVVLGVLLPQLTILKSANATGVTAGSTVAYTITLTNTGQTDYEGITAADDLTAVLDDATYNDDAATTAGTVDFDGTTLTWTGDDLPMDATATITYSVTVHDPDTGDHAMTNTVVSAAPGSTCPSGGTDPSCTTTVTVLTTVLAIGISADTASIVEGGTVHYTLEITNNGEAPYVDISVTNSLAGVLDDAAYNNDAVLTGNGTLDFTSPDLTWTGSLGVGESATITYSVSVDLPSTGDRSLVDVATSSAPGSSCPPPGSDTGCTATTTVVEQTITLADVTPTIDLAGTPGTTVSQDGAVTMTVTTNSLTGYAVTVQATAPVLAATTPGNTASIPIGNLRVRETGTIPYQPLSNTSAVVVHSQSTPSAPAGDFLSNDYELSVPLSIIAGGYAGTLNYVAMTL